MANTISPISFPSAAPGADSAEVRLQNGVRYIGHIGTDGPAVWEQICRAYGVDSQSDAAASLQALISAAINKFLLDLPNGPLADAVSLNGTLINVDRS